jgi:hypothetical protein
MKINSKVIFSLALAFLILPNMVAIGQKLQGRFFLLRGVPDSGGQFLTLNDGKFTDTFIKLHVLKGLYSRIKAR